ncbi:MAG: endolytic transglycosylase MltG, partial [Acidimicrobiales bacterium]
ANQFLTATAALAAASPYQPDLNPPSLAGSADNVNAFEGLVGVGHYVLEPGETGAQLATAMASGFSKEAAAVGLTTSTRVAGLNAYQLITAASIVEREGYYPSNMPKVARVVFNRLAHHGPLQMDSTVKYPLGMDAGVVTPALLQTVTPYNTYRVTGLTPTPICAVSTAALTATLHAPPGPWYYFVVINKQGVERFSVTYAEQQAAEKVAQRNGVG